MLILAAVIQILAVSGPYLLCPNDSEKSRLLRIVIKGLIGLVGENVVENRTLHCAKEFGVSPVCAVTRGPPVRRILTPKSKRPENLAAPAQHSGADVQPGSEPWTDATGAVCDSVKGGAGGMEEEAAGGQRGTQIDAGL